VRPKAKILLLHGFSGAPDELAYLAERLEAVGYESESPCLPGHAPNALDLTTAGSREWLVSARAALARLGPAPAPVVGFSMGGLLALCLAAEQPDRVSGLSLLAPALRLTQPASMLSGVFHALPFLGRVIPRLPKWGGRALRDPVQRARYPGWGTVPTHGLSQLPELQDTALAAATRVRCPVQILIAERDRTVAVAGIARLQQHLSTPVTVQSFSESGHQLALDTQRAEVAGSLIAFLARLPS
jgi:carboxylesterase